MLTRSVIDLGALADKLIAESNDPTIMADQRFVALYTDLGQPAKVISVWKSLIVAEPTNLNHRSGLIAAYLKQGNTTQALAELRAILTLNPTEQVKQSVLNYIKEIEAGKIPAL